MGFVSSALVAVVLCILPPFTFLGSSSVHCGRLHSLPRVPMAKRPEIYHGEHPRGWEAGATCVLPPPPASGSWSVAKRSLLGRRCEQHACVCSAYIYVREKILTAPKKMVKSCAASLTGDRLTCVCWLEKLGR